MASTKLAAKSATPPPQTITPAPSNGKTANGKAAQVSPASQGGGGAEPKRRGRPPGKRNAVPAPPIAQSTIAQSTIAQSTPQRRVSATPAAPPRPPGPSPEVRRAAMLLKQAGDPTRLQLLLLLASGERHVGALCADLGGQSQPAVSHHLALCRHGQLVETRRQGKLNIYSLTEQGRALATVVSELVGG